MLVFPGHFPYALVPFRGKLPKTINNNQRGSFQTYVDRYDIVDFKVWEPTRKQAEREQFFIRVINLKPLVKNNSSIKAVI